MFRTLIGLLSCVGALWGGEAGAAVNLTGSAVFYSTALRNAEVGFPDQGTGPFEAVVGPGAEFNFARTNNSPGVVIDVQESTVSVIYSIDSPNRFVRASFNGAIFEFTGAPAIASVSFDAATTLALNAADIRFGPDRITVDLAGVALLQTGVGYVLNVTFVPLPATLPLLAAVAGVLGAATAWRRRLQRTACR